MRILKDLELDLKYRDVLVVEDIVDSGLTLKYLLKNLAGRKPASLEVAALLRKEGIQQVELDLRYVGFDIPNEFVVGYGLDTPRRPEPSVHRHPEAIGLRGRPDARRLAPWTVGDVRVLRYVDRLERRCRACLARLWPTADPDALLRRYHRLEPSLEADGSNTYRKVLTRSSWASRCPRDSSCRRGGLGARRLAPVVAAVP